MEKIKEKFYRKINTVSLKFKRTYFYSINWESRMIGIRGARGVGKTTLILQYIKENLPINETVIYVSLDDIYFSSNTLSDFVDIFVKKGGRFLFVDEVHKYNNWSTELKNIFDDFSELKIVFTGSSILPLIESKSDLSRRAMMYDISGLSFREFLNFSENSNFTAVTFDEILKNHLDIALSINSKLRPLAKLVEYNKIGHYPYFIENKDNYLYLLNETINQTIESDIPFYLHLDINSIDKMKKLLYIIATSVPFKPNISKLSQQLDINRNTLKQFLHYLDKANILNLLFSSAKGDSLLLKPEKIYLKHSNLMFVLAANDPNIGTIRETFFLNQVKNNNSVNYTNEGVFFVNNKYRIEVGGKNKNFKQISNIPNSFIAADDIEFGVENKIPLYLFGFLY